MYGLVPRHQVMEHEYLPPQKEMLEEVVAQSPPSPCPSCTTAAPDTRAWSAVRLCVPVLDATAGFRPSPSTIYTPFFRAGPWYSSSSSQYSSIYWLHQVPVHWSTLFQNSTLLRPPPTPPAGEDEGAPPEAPCSSQGYLRIGFTPYVRTRTYEN